MKWTIGDVTVTKIVELEMTGGSRFLLPQATPETILPITWLQPHFADENGRLRMSIHSFIVETPDQFVAWYQNHPDQTFWERTTHSTIAVYENVARVTRTYEVRSTPTGPVTSTGIEDFQLIFDGKEWRAFSLLWQDATPGKPLPPGYLP